MPLMTLKELQVKKDKILEKVGELTDKLCDNEIGEAVYKQGMDKLVEELENVDNEIKEMI